MNQATKLVKREDEPREIERRPESEPYRGYGYGPETGENEVHLLVSDSGDGFDLRTARTDRGLGLVSMSERLKLVAGELSIETQPGRGTRIHAHAPYSVVKISL